MSDVRAMLRAERAARGTTSSASAPAAANTKKRKAADPGIAEIVKRLRAEEESREDTDGHKNGHDQEPAPKVRRPSRAQEHKPSTDTRSVPEPEPDTRPPEVTDPVSESKADAVDEDEWAAFEADIAALDAEPPEEQRALSGNAGATIIRAPMTVAEVEAQKEREKRKHRRREEEVELEKEDAELALQEEFDEIERLEDRARKVREMRERIRERHAKEDAERNKSEGRAEQAEQEEDDDDDDTDDWFG